MTKDQFNKAKSIAKDHNYLKHKLVGSTAIFYFEFEMDANEFVEDVDNNLGYGTLFHINDLSGQVEVTVSI